MECEKWTHGILYCFKGSASQFHSMYKGYIIYLRCWSIYIVIYDSFIANTGSLCHKRMPAHEIRSQKNPKYLTRTKSFHGVHLYLLPRGTSRAVPLVPLYFFMAWTSTTPPLAACLFHLGNKSFGCISSRIIEMERNISNWSNGSL